MARSDPKRSGRAASIRRVVAPFARPQRSRIVRLSIASVLAGFAEAGVLVLIARVAFALTSGKKSVGVRLGPLGTESFDIELLIAAAAILILLRMLLQAVAVVLSTRATADVMEETRREVLTLYLAAGWPLQSAQREGRLQELLTTYAAGASSAVGAIGQVAINGFNLTALLLVALWVNPVASIAAGGAALVIGLALRPIRGAVRRRSARAAAAGLDLATSITELSSTLQEVRIFGVERAVGERIDGLNQRSARQVLATGYAASSVAVLYQGVALLLIVAALAITYGAGITRLASLGAIVLIVLRSLSYAQALQSSIQALYQSAPYLEALHEEEDRYRAAAMSHGGQPIERIGSLGFDHVSFEYETGVPVLKDISFAVHPGEVIGIVGPSGSGKSTLVQLLLRLREPTAGTFLVDGRDAREFALDDWYRHVSFVPQEPRLFAGTVADNIRFFRDGINDDAVRTRREARESARRCDLVGERL